jgi:hypothetical protein
MLSGQKVYVAEMGELFHSEAQNWYDARLRIIFDNGTESDQLMSSLQRALNKDEYGRRISDSNADPLFSAKEPMTIKQVGLSTFYAVSPIYHSFCKIGMYYTKLVSQAEAVKTELPMQVRKQPSYSLMSR